jgi:uncharacterized metal-binding protein YceD (DUF177 family)
VTKPQPELSRVIEVSRIPPTGCTETIIADPSECSLVARRLDLPAVHSLKAELALSRWRGDGVKVTGRFDAEVEQICVVTLDQFRANVSDTIERYFLTTTGSGEEEADIDSFEGDLLELGEIVVESLSLALDPYPRKPGVQFQGPSDDSTPATAERVSSPFAALADMKARTR